MDGSTALSSLGSLPGAFAAACRLARNDSELFERCREAMVQRFGSERIWFSVTSPDSLVSLTPPPEWLARAIEVIRLTSGQTELVIQAEPAIVGELRAQAMPLALGLSIVLELRSILLDRQAPLDDAVFQLRALRQVARLLSSVHSTEETEQLILDFMAEVFFAWWACLYRPRGRRSTRPRCSARSRTGRARQADRPRRRSTGRCPRTAPVTSTEDVGGRAADAARRRSSWCRSTPARSAWRCWCWAPGSATSRTAAPSSELAGTLSFAAAIALKNAQLVEQLHSAATTDELTGLYNRRALEERLAAEISRSHAAPAPTTSPARPRPLQVGQRHDGPCRRRPAARPDRRAAQAAVPRPRCRGPAGGRRVPGDPADDHARRGPGLRAAGADSDSARLEAQHPGVRPAPLSMGIAESPRHGTTRERILAAADAALYRAKRGGRNAVEVAEG